MRRAVALLTLGAVAFGFTYSDHAPLIPLVSAEFGLDDPRYRPAVDGAVHFVHGDDAPDDRARGAARPETHGRCRACCLGRRRVMRIGDRAIVAGVALLAIPERPLPIALGGAMLVGLGVGLPYSAVFNTRRSSAPRRARRGAGPGGDRRHRRSHGRRTGDGLRRADLRFLGRLLFIGTLSAIALVGTAFMRGEGDLPGGGSAPADPRP